MYHSRIFEAWNVSERPADELRDVTPHLVAYQNGIETLVPECVHITGQYSRLPCMHTLIFFLTTVLSGAEERVAEERPGWNFQIFKKKPG